jgi:hypothetical protein
MLVAVLQLLGFAVCFALCTIRIAIWIALCLLYIVAAIFSYF